MAIDHVDRRDRERTDRGSISEIGPGAVLVRSLVMVVIAALAILAILPAALAAQAASTV